MSIGLAGLRTARKAAKTGARAALSREFIRSVLAVGGKESPDQLGTLQPLPVVAYVALDRIALLVLNGVNLPLTVASTISD